jgi:hypothetical protein
MDKTVKGGGKLCNRIISSQKKVGKKEDERVYMQWSV